MARWRDDLGVAGPHRSVLLAAGFIAHYLHHGVVGKHDLGKLLLRCAVLAPATWVMAQKSFLPLRQQLGEYWVRESGFGGLCIAPGARSGLDGTFGG